MGDTKHLGKISKVQFGFVGYQECMFGLSLEFCFDGSSYVGTTISGGWYDGITPSTSSQWTEYDRSKQRLDMCNKINKLMMDAKVLDITELMNKPVELTMQGNIFKDFRILTEVL